MIYAETFIPSAVHMRTMFKVIRLIIGLFEVKWCRQLSFDENSLLFPRNCLRFRRKINISISYVPVSAIETQNEIKDMIYLKYPNK